MIPFLVFFVIWTEEQIRGAESSWDFLGIIGCTVFTFGFVGSISLEMLESVQVSST